MPGEQLELDPTDLVSLGVRLTARELQVQQAVRAFVLEHVRPHVTSWFSSGEVPGDIFPMLGRLGAFGSPDGPLGAEPMGDVAFGLACLELEAGDSGIRSMLSAQRCLAMHAIEQFGSAEQKARWLPAMSSGHAVGAFGLSEPDAGSDPSAMRATARHEGSDWLVSGTKRWVLNGSVADVAVVWARTEEGVRGFLVPKESRGLTSAPMPTLYSLRAAVTSELVLDDCRVPADAALPGVVGLRGPLSCLNEARLGVVWGAFGAARSCFQRALSYVKDRTQFGRPLASFQLTQANLADMALELEKGLLLVLHLSRLKERGALSPAHLSIGKLNVREALTIARRSRALLGANGLNLNHEVMRHMVNLETVLSYEGTSEVHQLVIGRSLTNMDAFRG